MDHLEGAAMQYIGIERVHRILAENSPGIDALSIIPVPDLAGPLEHALTQMRRGFVPGTYHWTGEKTEHAYAYKDYGEWARSIIVAAKYYYTSEEYPDKGGYIPGIQATVPPLRKRASQEPGTARSGRPFGRIARFTWRNNYRYLTVRLSELIAALERNLGIPIRAKALSNYTSIPEKVLFAFSGLASFGKNCVLISREMGSYFVVAEALTDLAVDFAGTPLEGRLSVPAPDFLICGNCSRCMDACPTGAIVEQGVLDMNRCFQYLSENLVPIPREYRPKWGNRLYGCSTCIDVCPYNSELEPCAEKHNVGHVGTGEDIIKLLSYSPEQWERRFMDNQLIIRDQLAIVQNAMLCLGNYPSEDAYPILLPYLSHESPVLRSSTVWALGRMDIRKCRDTLENRLGNEENQEVRKEIERFL